MGVKDTVDQIARYLREKIFCNSNSTRRINIDKLWKETIPLANGKMKTITSVTQVINDYCIESETKDETLYIIQIFNEFRKPKSTHHEKLKYLPAIIGFLPFFGQKHLISILESIYDIFQSIPLTFSQLSNWADYCSFCIIEMNSLKKIYNFISDRLSNEEVFCTSFLFYVLFPQFFDSIPESIDKVELVILKLIENTELRGVACMLSYSFFHSLSCVISTIDPRIIDFLFTVVSMGTHKEVKICFKSLRFALEDPSYQTQFMLDKVLNLRSSAKKENIESCYNLIILFIMSVMYSEDEREINEVNKLVKRCKREVLERMRQKDVNREERLMCLVVFASIGDFDLTFTEDIYEEGMKVIMEEFDSLSPDELSSSGLFSAIASKYWNNNLIQSYEKLFEKYYSVFLSNGIKKKSYITICDAAVSLYLFRIKPLFKDESHKIIITLLSSMSKKMVTIACQMVITYSKSLDLSFANRLLEVLHNCLLSIQDKKSISSIYHAVKKIMKRSSIDEELLYKIAMLGLGEQIPAYKGLPYYHLNSNEYEVYHFYEVYFRTRHYKVAYLFSVFCSAFNNCLPDNIYLLLYPMSEYLNKGMASDESIQTIMPTFLVYFERFDDISGDLNYIPLIKTAALLLYRYPSSINLDRIAGTSQNIYDFVYESSEDSDHQALMKPFLLILLIEIARNPEFVEEYQIEQIIDDFPFKEDTEFNSEIVNILIKSTEYDEPPDNIEEFVFRTFIRVFQTSYYSEEFSIDHEASNEMLKYIRNYAQHNPDSGSIISDISPNTAQKRKLLRMIK